MTKQERINKIKESLKSLMKFSEGIKNEGFNNFDLTDGTRITSPDTDLMVGSEVYAIDDQGNQTPLEDGEYVLADGTTITVSGGSVESVASSEAESAEDAGTEAEPEEEMKKVKMDDSGLPENHTEESKGQEVNPMESRITDIESQIENILNILNKLGDSQNEVNEQMMSKIESFSKENGGTPIKLGKKDYNSFNKSEGGSLRDELIERLKK